MTVLQIIPWNADAIIFGIPMVAVVFASLFKIDEVFAAPKKRQFRGHPLCDWDENGHSICIQPDGDLVRQVPKERRSRRG